MGRKTLAEVGPFTIGDTGRGEVEVWYNDTVVEFGEPSNLLSDGQNRVSQHEAALEEAADELATPEKIFEFTDDKSSHKVAVADGDEFVIVPSGESYTWTVFTDTPYEDGEYDDAFWKFDVGDFPSDCENTYATNYEYVRHFDEMNVVESPFVDR